MTNYDCDEIDTSRGIMMPPEGYYNFCNEKDWTA